MAWRFWISCVVFALLAGCSRIPVSVDYSPDWQFQPSSSFAWMPRETRGSDPLVENDLLDQRVRRAVTEQLRARGLVEASIESADLLVTYHVGLQDKVDINTFRSSFGYYPCWHCVGWGYGTEVWVTEYTQNTLVIDLVSAETRKLVWRGVAERRLPNLRTPAERDAYMNETVAAILADFPPR